MADNVKDLKKHREQKEGGGELPSLETLSDVMRQLSEHSADMAEARGQIGALVQEAEKSKNVHRKALKLAYQVREMDATKAEEFLVHFEHYVKTLGLTDQMNLFGQSAAAAE